MCFCINYRRLNATTKLDMYSLPRIDDSLHLLADTKICSIKWKKKHPIMIPNHNSARSTDAPVVEGKIQARASNV